MSENTLPQTEIPVRVPDLSTADPGITGNAHIKLGQLRVDDATAVRVDVLQDPSVEERTVPNAEWEATKRRLDQQDTMIKAMIQIFALLNGAVIFFVFAAWGAGFWGKEEIISENVVMSLIAATVIQAGIAFITITRFLFPSEGRVSR